MNQLQLRRLLESYFLEDIGEQDVTTTTVFDRHTQGEIIILAKDDGVFAGEDVIRTGFSILDPTIDIEMFVRDGETLVNRQEIAKLSGSIQALLTGERVILNTIQRMSGIATLTSQAVTQLGQSNTRVCDTRKTTPGFRMFEKYAVRCGGGFNHRIGLYDGVMIKDNHIAFCGSIAQAVTQVRSQTGQMVKVEVETESAAQVKEAVEAGADIIMFDNCTPEDIQQLIKLVPSHIITEASGGIEMHQLAAYAETGVDYISLGFLTHAYHALDMSAIVKIEGEL